MLSAKINELGNELTVKRDGKDILIILDLNDTDESTYIVLYPFPDHKIKSTVDEQLEDGWTHKLVDEGK